MHESPLEALIFAALKMKNFLCLLLITCTLCSCDNEVDLNAPYRQTAVVYAFLDQNEPLQYIRIQKTFQNKPGSAATEGGQKADSLYFKNLKVELMDVSWGYDSTTKRIPCVRIDSVPKAIGTFASNEHYLYVVALPKDNTRDVTWRIEIKDTTTGAFFYSESRMVRDAVVNSGTINFYNSNLWQFSFVFTTAKNAVLYDAFIRFKYKEMSAADTNIAHERYYDYNIIKNKESDGLGGEQLRFQVKGIPFLSSISEYFKIIEPNGNPSVKRRVVGFEYVVYGGSDDFKNLLDVSAPSQAIVQKKPFYSNIHNGIGIFTSRNRMVRSDIVFDQSTVDFIVNNTSTFIK